MLGVIYNPFLEQLYTATKGGGAFLAQGTRPATRLPLADPPRPLPSLSQALIGIEWGSDRSLEMVEKKGESFKRLAGDPKTGVVKGKMAHSLRSLGSAALNYGLVAQGGLDFYWCVYCRFRVAGECMLKTITGRLELGTCGCDTMEVRSGHVLMMLAGPGISARVPSSHRRPAAW